MSQLLAKNKFLSRLFTAIYKAKFVIKIMIFFDI